MKKLFHILPFLLILAGCANKEKLPSDPCGFDIRIDKVGGTKVWYTITPDNSNAFYTFGVVNSYDDDYDMSPASMAALQLQWMINVYENYATMVDSNLSSFSDVYLYKGAREFKTVDLARNTEHKLIVMQVDPETRTMIGQSAMVIFHTQEIEMVPLDFELVFHADAVEVIPSDDSYTYYWDYEDTDVILSKYYSPYDYFYSLCDMFEEYDFMNNLLDQGPVEWIFSKEDKAMKEGDYCTLVVAGYANGEINTPYTLVDFIYHKDTPIEVINRWEDD